MSFCLQAPPSSPVIQSVTDVIIHEKLPEWFTANDVSKKIPQLTLSMATIIYDLEELASEGSLQRRQSDDKSATYYRSVGLFVPPLPRLDLSLNALSIIRKESDHFTTHPIDSPPRLSPGEDVAMPHRNHDTAMFYNFTCATIKERFCSSPASPIKAHFYQIAYSTLSLIDQSTSISPHKKRCITACIENLTLAYQQHILVNMSI